MSTRSRPNLVLLITALAAGCAAADSPELACQQRIAGVNAQAGPQTESEAAANPDPFGHRDYAALDRTGCTPRQLAALERIAALTKALPELTAANERTGLSGDKAAHMAAFQRMNDALIELNNLQQRAKSDLDMMTAEPR